jgi:hypothetical protein
MFVKNSTKFIIIVVIALALSGFTYAFAEANTVPATFAGDGAEDISGYIISGVHYTLDVGNPALINAVIFTLDNAATTVRVKLVQAGTTYYTCTVAGGTSVSCNIGGAVTVLAADELRVIATN